MKEKKCSNCDDFIVCYQNEGKEPTKVCSQWNLDINGFQELFKGINLTSLRYKEIETIINQNYK